MNIKFIGVRQLLIVSLLTTITLNAKVCKEANRDGSTVTYKTTSNKCNWTHKTELVYKYKNGTIKSKQHYIDNVENGTSKSYFENGKLKSIATFKNGNVDGASKIYHKNEKVQYERTYDNGIPVGTHKRYYKDGNLEWEKIYTNADKYVKKTYYNSGVLKYEEHFSNGKIPSTKTYFASGKIKTISTTKNGNKDIQQTYNEKGVLLKDFKFTNNKKSGFECSIGRKGHKKRETIYKDNKKVSVKQYSTDGNLQRETIYNADGTHTSKRY